jgi:hypothetical protein
MGHVYVDCMQAIMKIITLGFVFNGRNSYLRSAWNALDLFVALIGIVVLVVESCTDTHNLFWLRALRALRCGCLLEPSADEQTK